MKNKQIEEIVKIICQYRTDDGKCTCNQYQFGVRKCADPCVYRDRAEQLVDAGYAPVVHAEWINRRNGNATCSNCRIRSKAVYDLDNEQHYCGHCGAKMDGGAE